MKNQIIRAVYDEETITVYQAYNPLIADAAVKAQTFVSPPFKIDRMTWIKPSFIWMMYRCGWAKKENQERVLAIRIRRSGFEWALQHSCLSHFDKTVHQSQEEWKKALQESPVRIQWDPEKDIHLHELPYRSIQIGLSGIAVVKYVNEWITRIDDITSLAHQAHALLLSGNTEAASRLLPEEKIYPLDQKTSQIVKGDY